MKRQGFTLVEILVVIGILIGIAAIALPVIALIREKGRQPVCQNNLRQLGLILQQYAQDNDRHYPHATYVYGSEDYLTKSHTGLPSRIKTPQILWCPSGLQPYPGTYAVAFGGGKSYPVPPPPDSDASTIAFTNYAYNSELLNGSKSEGREEASFRTTDDLILLYDMAFDARQKSVSLPSCPDKVNGEEFAIFHSGGADYLFGDGRVEWMRPERAAQLQCMAARENAL